MSRMSRTTDEARRHEIAATHSLETGFPSRRVALECVGCGVLAVTVLGEKLPIAECETCGARGHPDRVLAAHQQQPRRAAA